MLPSVTEAEDGVDVTVMSEGEMNSKIAWVDWTEPSEVVPCA